MYYILIGVIVLVVVIDLYLKKKNNKDKSTDLDKVKNIKKTDKKRIYLIIFFPLFLIIVTPLLYFTYYVPKAIIESEILYINAVEKALEVRENMINFDHASISERMENEILQAMEEPIQLSLKAVDLLKKANYFNYSNPKIYNNLAYNYLFLQTVNFKLYYNDSIGWRYYTDKALKVDPYNVEALKLKHVDLNWSNILDLPSNIRNQNFLNNYYKDKLKFQAQNGGFSFTANHPMKLKKYPNSDFSINFDCFSINPTSFINIIDFGNKDIEKIIEYANYIASQPDECEPMLRSHILIALSDRIYRLNHAFRNYNTDKVIPKSRSHAKSNLEFRIKAYELNKLVLGDEKKYFDTRTFKWCEDLLPVYLKTTKTPNSYATKSYTKKNKIQLLSNIAHKKYSLNINNFRQIGWNNNYGNNLRKTSAESDIGIAILELNNIDKETTEFTSNGYKSNRVYPPNTLYYHSYLIKKSLGDWAGACADITRAAEEDNMWLEEKLSYCK